MLQPLKYSSVAHWAHPKGQAEAGSYQEWSNDAAFGSVLRHVLRDKMVDLIGEKPTAQRMKLFRTFANALPNNSARGALFARLPLSEAFRSAYINRLAGSRKVPGSEQIVEGHPKSGSERTADDRVRIAGSLEGIPAGDYYLDYKTGPDALDLKQGRDYNRAMATSQDGFAYVFSNKREAVNSLERLQQYLENHGETRNPKLRMMYLDDDGILTALSDQGGSDAL